jgi:hypothetical protein
MTLTSSLLVALAILSWVVPLTLLVALVMWWRRTRHWSFAVLAAAMLFYCLGQLAITADEKRLDIGGPNSKTPNSSQAFTRHMERVLAGTAVFFLLLGVGGAGLISASRSHAV